MQKFILPAVLAVALGFVLAPSQTHAGGISITISPGVPAYTPGCVYPPQVYCPPSYDVPPGHYPYVVTPSYFPRYRDEWREHHDEHHDWDRHDDRGHDRHR